MLKKRGTRKVNDGRKRTRSRQETGKNVRRKPELLKRKNSDLMTRGQKTKEERTRNLIGD